MKRGVSEPLLLAQVVCGRWDGQILVAAMFFCLLAGLVYHSAAAVILMFVLWGLVGLAAYGERVSR